MTTTIERGTAFLSGFECENDRRRTVSEKGVAGEIGDHLHSNALAAKQFVWMQDHLQRREVDLSNPVATLGSCLVVDAKSQSFADNGEANARLKRNCACPASCVR